MIGRRLALAVVVGTLLIAHVAPVGATTIVRTDRDDTPSPLDLRRVVVSHAAYAHVFRIATHDAFRDGQIDGERGWFRIGVDQRGEEWRRSVYVYVVKGELRGVVTNEDREFLRFVYAHRIAPDQLEVRVPLSVSGGTPYRFAVWSVWNRPPCSRATPCVDWVPDTGTIRHAGAAQGT